MLMTSGCGVLSPQPALQPGTLPTTITLAQTPFYPQARYQCGPAALATMLGAQSIPVTPAELVDEVYVPALRGSMPTEMAASARGHSLLVYPLDARLEALLEEIAAGHPVLVFQNLGLDWLPRHHFAVLVGYDLASERLWLRSGTTRLLKTTFDNFLRTWSRGGHLAWVMLTPGQLPASARPERYLQAAWALEQTAGSRSALPAWLASTQRWPQSTQLLQASGNAAYAATDYAAALHSYLAVLSITPSSTDTWNNLAYTLLALDCPRQAVDAARCAQRHSPASANYRATLAEIDVRARQRESAVGACPKLPACGAVRQEKP